jgi:hypothetical protein
MLEQPNLDVSPRSFYVLLVKELDFEKVTGFRYFCVMIGFRWAAGVGVYKK